MSEIENGGPAFPFAFTDGSRVSDGMTLLDYFAAKAMQAIISQPEWENMSAEKIAFWAYEQAEEMLFARPGAK